MDRWTEGTPSRLTAAFRAVGQLVERRRPHPEIVLELQEERLVPRVAAREQSGGESRAGGDGAVPRGASPDPDTHFPMSCAAFFSTSPRGHVVLFSCTGK